MSPEEFEQKFRKAEGATDSTLHEVAGVLRWLIRSPYTLPIVAGLVVGVIFGGLWAWL